MRRDRFSGDYERIRRYAGMARPEFPEPDERPAPGPSPLDDDFRARMDELARYDALKAAERKASADALTARSNERARLAEYAAAGVDPVDGASLSMLLRLGWTIAEVGGKRELVRPPDDRRQRSRGEEGS